MTDDKKDPQTATSEQGNDLELTITTKEGLVIDAPVQHGGELKRNLAQRHLLMLAVGGVIGPGYFVGMGNGLSSAGPAGLLICFSIVGTLLYAVMQSIGELDNLGLVLTFWDTAMPRWGWIMVFWVIFMAFTFLGVKSFGEAEFWLASIKVLFILIFFICAILISTGVIGGEKIGFKFYRDPGPFADGVKGVFKIFVFAALQYSGTEMVGLTAGESANPSKDVPKAVKSVVWRIVVIFLGGIFFLTITVPFNDPNLLNAANKTARSPFVIAFTRVGVNAGAHAVNAVIVITILSAVNAALYVGSRTLYGLAVEKQAPRIFAMTNSRGVPVYAYVFMNTVGFLSLLNLASGAGQFYTWVVSMTGVATFITCKHILPSRTASLTKLVRGLHLPLPHSHAAGA
ncbi:General amino acid permease AGP3 [Cercospora beticola]|uniref:General amino acid permease AGP3 n=1 Tax=Cercospora beticola TaxID=122368 RepID=A0A2G5IAS3_CERBT|nr:General amino acid permease AGP3 [Cercospora beticola]PIB01871.1 General amino acid permease AGP3 [Cercospora beticola]